MGIISALIKAGLVAGASITAYQASEQSKAEEGRVTADSFARNFKDQAVVNSKLVVDAVKSKLGSAKGGYTVSDEGENGYKYPDSAEDKVTEIFEDMKEKAPDVIGKVQDIVEDVRDKAPEVMEKAQVVIDGVKDVAKKLKDKDDE